MRGDPHERCSQSYMRHWPTKNKNKNVPINNKLFLLHVDDIQGSIGFYYDLHIVQSNTRLLFNKL